MKTRRKQADNDAKKKDKTPQGSCSLCGQLYHNFAFKGGYICEDCLNTIKKPNSRQEDPNEKT